MINHNGHNGHNGELSLGTLLIRSEQDGVNELFDAGSSYWTDIYTEHDVFGGIYRQRRDIALRIVDELSLPKASQILEGGCGAVLTELEMVRRGHRIYAIAIVSAM